MILFDTDTITLLSYGQSHIRDKIDRLVGNELGAIAVVTRGEILRGRVDNILKAANAEELRKAIERYERSEYVISKFTIIGFDEDSIQYFEKLRHHKSLKKIGRADLLIACIALSHNALLVTRNLRDFKSVPGVRIENWID